MIIIINISFVLIALATVIQFLAKRFDVINNFILKFFQFNGFPFLSLTTRYSWFSWFAIGTGLSWLTGLARLARWCIFAAFSFRSRSSRIAIFARSTRLSWCSSISFLSRFTRGSWYVKALSRKALRSLFSYFTIITWFSNITFESLRTWLTSRSLRARMAFKSLYMTY